MSWRTVVIASSAKLDYQLGFLVIRKEDTVKIHLGEISMLIVENTSVSLTAALLSELTKKKIKVIFCDEKRNPSSELVSYYGCHDTSSKIRRQLNWTEDAKASIWTNIVREKIHKQAELLERYRLAESAMLYKYMDEVRPNDDSNREGHAAKVYFNALFGKDFTRSLENSTNAALNYGYGIILSAFNREIVANGYITQLGLFHDNMFNQFNLGSDLMEPFRVLVDCAVKNMMPQKFEHEEKVTVLKILQQEVRIGNRREYVNNAIKIYCRSVFDALNENDALLIKFYENEL
ncbi:MAG: type II CRISPR-associated endonuclease Cas1 [Ruminococcus sp.]|nr:type II CRISPR-associated endonuclease Cas1 [Ruminococcus sp.]